MNEISLSDAIRYLLSKSKVIVSATLFCALVAVFVSLYVQEIYRSDALLRISESQVSTSPQMGAGFQSLASIAGIDLGSSNSTSSIKSPPYVIAKITSRSFFAHLATFPGILEGLKAGKSFNPKTGEIILDESKYDSEQQKWLSIPRGGNLPGKPTALEARVIFLKGLTITADRKTQFISMSYEHSSPFFAKELLELVVKEVNSLQMKQDLEQAKKELEYLTNLKANNKLVNIEKSISVLMSNLIQSQMLANIKDEYLIEYIDQPYLPDSRIFPRRTIMVTISTILSFFLIVFGMLFYRFVLPNSLESKTKDYSS